MNNSEFNGMIGKKFIEASLFFPVLEDESNKLSSVKDAEFVRKDVEIESVEKVHEVYKSFVTNDKVSQFIVTVNFNDGKNVEYTAKSNENLVEQIENKLSNDFKFNPKFFLCIPHHSYDGRTYMTYDSDFCYAFEYEVENEKLVSKVFMIDNGETDAEIREALENTAKAAFNKMIEFKKQQIEEQKAKLAKLIAELENCENLCK